MARFKTQRYMYSIRNINIKTKIYWSFFLLVSLFIVNAIVTIYTLYNNNKSTRYYSNIITPSIQKLGDFKKMLIESKMYSTNWVFLRWNQEDKNALLKIHNTDYRELKSDLNNLSVHWKEKNWIDSLNQVYRNFDALILIEKKVTGSLKKFEDYDDPVLKMEAEQLVEDEIIPRSATLITSLNNILDNKGNNRELEQTKLMQSSIRLRTFIIILAITIVGAGLFLALYMTRIIIRPINSIRHIINDLGKGLTRKIEYNTGSDEIGRMVRSVNKLSEKLQTTAAFATEIGNRNFDCYFEPLSADDSLGIALIAMRNNIKSSDAKLNEAQHIAHIGSWERDFKTDKVTFSDEMFNIYELDPATFNYKTQTIFKLIHPEDLKYVKDVINKNKNFEPLSFDFRIITPKGTRKNVFVQTKIVRGENGEVAKTFGIVQDITERKRGEEKIASEQELFRIMINNMPDQIYLKDRESRFLLSNMPLVEYIGGKSMADIIGKTDFDFFPFETAKQFFEVEQSIMQSGKPLFNNEGHKVDNITGAQQWNLITKVPLKDHAGKTIGLIGINRDITERKISDKKIEDVSRELSILFNSIDEVFFSIDMIALKYIQISGSCEKLCAYKPADFLAEYKLWSEIIHPDDKDLFTQENAEWILGKQINNEYRIIRKDNVTRWVESKITPTLDKAGKLIRVDGVARDITERKKAETELHNSEERYRRIVETAQEGIWMIDENNSITFCNKKMCEILEYSYEEVIGKRLFDFMDEQGKKTARQRIEQRKPGMDGNYDVRYFTKSGKGIWTNISTSEIFSEDEKYLGTLAMVTDITKRKHNEELLQKSEVYLEQQNKELERKNKELEQFAYVASHDLQEPLRTTSSFVELLQRQYHEKLDAKASKYIGYIVQASDRMGILIKDLLDFSRIGIKKELEPVDCNGVLCDVITDIDRAIKDTGAEINSQNLPVINGYSTEMKQLFQNLILNAIKFRKGNIPPKINISVQKKSDYWQFAFTDNGIGIDKQYSERIFIIFQRLHTRSEYEGSGIGLSHCKKIVELHHGKIWVESIPGQGSTFYFTIHSLKDKINDTKIKLHTLN